MFSNVKFESGRILWKGNLIRKLINKSCCWGWLLLCQIILWFLKLLVYEIKLIFSISEGIGVKNWTRSRWCGHGSHGRKFSFGVSEKHRRCLFVKLKLMGSLCFHKFVLLSNNICNWLIMFGESACSFTCLYCFFVPKLIVSKREFTKRRSIYIIAAPTRFLWLQFHETCFYLVVLFILNQHKLIISKLEPSFYKKLFSPRPISKSLHKKTGNVRWWEINLILAKSWTLKK